MTQATLVIGIGNTWRGDDGVGPMIASALHEKELPNVKVVPNVADGLDLLDKWRDADSVYIVDALRGCAEPGTVIRVDALHETLPTEAGYSSHTFGLAEAIELGRTLGQLPKKLVVIGIEGQDFGMGDRISAVVENSARRVIAELCAELGDTPLQQQEIQHA